MRTVDVDIRANAPNGHNMFPLCRRGNDGVRITNIERWAAGEGSVIVRAGACFFLFLVGRIQ